MSTFPPRAGFRRPAPLCTLLGLLLGPPLAAAQPVPEAAPSAAMAEDLPRLAFRDLIQVEGGLARIAPAAQALAGHRVRMTGFMAKMEVAPKGGFYLVPVPVACDEEGCGTADLPPTAVFVVVRSAAGQEMPWSPRALEVSGQFEAGYRLGEDALPTHFRILLDRPQDLPRADQP